MSKLRIGLLSVLALLLVASQILAGPALAAGPSPDQAGNGAGEGRPVEGREIVAMEGLVDDQGRLLLADGEGTLTLSWPDGAQTLKIVTTKGAILADVLTEGYELVLVDSGPEKATYHLTPTGGKGEVTLRFQHAPAELESLEEEGKKESSPEQVAAVEELVWLGVAPSWGPAAASSPFAALYAADSTAERIILDVPKATLKMGEGGHLEWIMSPSASRKYKGSFLFELSYDKEGKANGITLQNKVNLRDYLEGVVPYESPASWPIEALKAQAVAARTFVAARKYNVVDSTAAQVYRGIYQDDTYRPKVERVVRETAGQMLIYNGNVANTTVYSSANGGYREESRYAFSSTGQGAVLPYLPGGKDEFTHNGKAIIPEEYYSKDQNGNYRPPANVYLWERFIEASVIEKLWPSIGTLQSIEIKKRTPKGRGVIEMALIGNKNTVVISGHEFRSKIGANEIRSNLLHEIEVLPKERKVRVKGGGFGHRAGMSQHGAAGLANLGISYKAILNHYYPGTQLAQRVNDASQEVTVKILDGASRLEWVIRPSHTVDLVDENNRKIKTLQGGKTYILTPVVERVAGANRYETAALISKNWPQADVVILARGDKFADALAGVPLAHHYQAPILLTTPEKLHEQAEAEIRRLKAKKVIILGGTEAIASQVEEALEAMNLEVERLFGESRYETALKIAEVVKANRVVVVNGQNFPDSISAAPLAAQRGYPIILTPAEQLEDGLKEALEAMNLTQIYIVGGEAAVSPEVERELAAIAPVKRNFGSNRYKTNIAAIKAFLGAQNLAGKQVYVATGNDFADALTGGVLAAREGTAVMLVGNKLDPAHRSFLKDTPIKELIFFGGEQAVSNEVAVDLLNEMYGK